MKIRCTRLSKREKTLYIYITRMETHPQKVQTCRSKYKHMKRKPEQSIINNEVEDLMLKGHLLPQIN